MQRDNRNVILFPTLKEHLEKKSLQALEERRYSEALSHINQLLSHKVYSHEVIVGKLICLMELGYYDEAENQCEDLLKLNNEYYYKYLHIYLTILFQTQKYDLLMEQIDYELTNNVITIEIKEQLQQLYDMAKQMKSDLISDESTKFIDKLHIAVDKENHMKQWQLIESMRRMSIDPPEIIFTYLKKEEIHPVVKTSIFKWLIDQKLTYEIKVHKFGLQVSVKPINFSNIRNHFLMKEVMVLMSDIEQNNPSLFILLEQLLYRYMYVRYPILPTRKDISKIAEALIYIGEQYLQFETNKYPSEEVLSYIEEIKMCEKLYLGVIEE